MSSQSTVTCEEVLETLREMGTAQNIKVYTRHGMGPDIFGVSFANLKKLEKRLGINHPLALELWKSGNADARHLAMKIADPKLATEEQLDLLARDLGYYLICDLLAAFVGATPFAKQKAEEWIGSGDEWIARAGWGIVAQLALTSQAIPEKWFGKWIRIIAREVHGAPNFTRHAMNNALIAIGVRNESLMEKAQAAAKKIGKVMVDHGETGCRTPDAFEYIEKTYAYRKAKAAKSTG